MVPTLNVTLPVVIGAPSPLTWTVRLPCQPARAGQRVLDAAPALGEPTGHRTWPAVGVVEGDDRRGADGHGAGIWHQRGHVAGGIARARGDVALARIEVDRG